MKTPVTTIRRHTAITQFSREHHFGLLLSWKIRQALKTGIETRRISNYVLFFFENDLAIHFAEEEKKLFSALPDELPLKQEAISDHEKIRELMAAIRANNSDPALLRNLADLLDKHIRFEERVLFNYLQQNLSDEQLTAMTGDHPPHEDADNHWDDKFWIMK